MRFILNVIAFSLISLPLLAQQPVKYIAKLDLADNANQTNDQSDSSNNIYYIKKNFLYKELHNPNELSDENDNDLARFNRWFNEAEVRCYPTGNLPRPDVLLTEYEKSQHLVASKKNKTSATSAWKPLGPIKLPVNFNGIGRINVIVIDPLDTNTLYVGSACGGVHISHDGGNIWTSNTDNFPSLSIADIAVNPIHTDTIYAATGDGYGYEVSGIFWGGLYTAGVMKSTDGGLTWHTTGLSYLQSNRDIIQKLIISPHNPNILLAGTRNGLFRTTDAGATWTKVRTGHVYSMALKPTQEDTIYAINNYDLEVSYDAGATWQILYAGLNPVNSRATIAVTKAAPDNIYVLDANENLKVSMNGGASFTATASPSMAAFYGYYDRVLAVSPNNINDIFAFGSYMTVSRSGGTAWSNLDPADMVHRDSHAIAINPLNSATLFAGNDGGIFVSRNDGQTWKNLTSGLMISQIYRIGSSQQNPDLLVAGLQDCGAMVSNGTDWFERVSGDGQDCAISPYNDYIQVLSAQHGYFSISYDQGNSFSHVNITSESGSWTSPVLIDPTSGSTIYFGYKNIFNTTNTGTSFNQVTSTAIFSGGATYMAMSPASPNVLYACDYGKIMRSNNKGVTWTNVSGNLPAGTVAFTSIAVDKFDSMKVYVTTSGYQSDKKVYTSSTGGTTWTNITGSLPNIPANCIAVDSSTPGALFLGTDMGVYYRDASMTDWVKYGTGLPNVIVTDLDINYGAYKLRAATYGRSAWETNLVKPMPNGIAHISGPKTAAVNVYPSPTHSTWRLVFQNKRPLTFTVKVTDAAGREVISQQNNDVVDASKLASGVYNIEISGDDIHQSIKAIKE